MFVSNIVSTVFLIALIFAITSVVRGGPFVACDDKSVKEMLKLTRIKKNEKMADLGSGDGKIVIAYAKEGAIAYGYEINPLLVLWSRFRIKREGLSDRATVSWKNMWKVDLSGFDIVTIYAISYVMRGLEKKLKKELKQGARVVSFAFKFPTWKPAEKESNVFLYKA